MHPLKSNDQQHRKKNECRRPERSGYLTLQRDLAQEQRTAALQLILHTCCYFYDLKLIVLPFDQEFQLTIMQLLER